MPPVTYRVIFHLAFGVALVHRADLRKLFPTLTPNHKFRFLSFGTRMLRCLVTSFIHRAPTSTLC